VTKYTTIAFPAPVAPAAALAALRGPVVAWTSREQTIVGLGVACELRGHGEARWQELVAAARALEVSGDVAPKLLGGAAFAPGGAERAPWTGFGDAWFVLPRWTYISDGASARLVLAVEPERAGEDRWREELQALRSALSARFVTRTQPPLVRVDGGDRDAWRAQVRAITDAIARGEHEKIVAARSATVVFAGEVRAADLLAELDARHGDCVRLLVRPPGGGTLVAATPERLVRKVGPDVACDALAGSRAPSAIRSAEPAGSRASADALLASGKDRREHELVVRAIAAALRELGAEVDMPATPLVRALRHVVHLHTPIAATLRVPCHVLELVARLHPTPAVGGTPTRAATSWIASHEAPRGWYAAPVGWFDLDGDGELAVALRCGVIAGERAHLWAGAGIVAGSDPERELAETELKLRAMLGALGVTGQIDPDDESEATR